MISVCIPTYNGEKFIKEQIYSILVQLGSEDEIIISDDQSTDRTLLLIYEINDPRIKIVKHNPAKSRFKFNLTSRNVENALNHAKGEIIFLADQDDIWMEDKVVETVPLLQKFDLVLHDCEVVDQNGVVINKSYFDKIAARKGIIKNLCKNSYLGCCMAFRSSLIEKVLPLPIGEVPHDIWIGLLAEYYGNVKFCEHKLVKYRRHSENLSFSAEKSENKFKYKLHYRMIILREFIKKILFK